MSAAVVVLLLSLFGVALGDQCLDCMCKVESQCKPLPCKWDDDAVSCGWFQLKSVYYRECGEPGRKGGESVDAAWKRCAGNKECSIQCINKYVSRYAGGCPGKSGCERMARLHNGGPSGCQGSQANKAGGYWNKIRQCMSG